MFLNCTNWLYICFSNSWSHIDFLFPSSTFLFSAQMVTFRNIFCITFLCSTCYKGLITHRVRYIFYSSLSLNRPPRNHLTIFIMENTCYYNITATTNNTWVIMSYFFMCTLCFGTDNSKFINTIFTLVHFFIISFIFSSFNRFNMWCTITTCTISVWEF